MDDFTCKSDTEYLESFASDLTLPRVTFNCERCSFLYSNIIERSESQPKVKHM